MFYFLPYAHLHFHFLCNENSSICALNNFFERENFTGDSILIYLIITLGQIPFTMRWIEFRGSLVRLGSTIPRPKPIPNIYKNSDHKDKWRPAYHMSNYLQGISKLLNC